MENLKFRVWDKKEKRMIYTPVCVCSGYGGWVLFTSNKEKNITPLTPYPIERFEVMQFSGMRDWKEKEIYENDIVWVIESEIFRYYKVGFKNSCFCLFNKNNDPVDFEYLLYDLPNSDYVKIIGNVYEDENINLSN